jgi:CO/xanthine dehydrogenase FAD-binding subunit
MVPIAGGTAVMVDVNGGACPEVLLDLSLIDEVQTVERADTTMRLGAGVTYTQIIEELEEPLPGLAAASRTIAGRQVRNRGTLGGALALADPSSDALAGLIAARATVELRTLSGAREVSVEEFVVGPGQTVLGPDELVTAFVVPVADGPVAYAKAGARNAMARAVCGVALALHPRHGGATVAVVGAGPRPVRAREAEELIAADAPWDDGDALEPGWAEEIGRRVAAAVPGLADVRGSAAYRRHLAAVLGRRALERAWAALGPAA